MFNYYLFFNFLFIFNKMSEAKANYLKNGNLEIIESPFFSKLLFSFMNEKIKLKVIKYNKKLQNKIDINLNNYKFYNGKYIIYENEKNIKGKEYMKSISGYGEHFLYEGEYLNGERNGKGKEYFFSGELIFEGEYLNGKRNGKGKDYYLNGKLRFEGEYLNGERLNGKLFDKKGNIYLDLQNANGLIKEYNVYGRLEFEGEYLNGKKNGKGKEYDDMEKLRFEGEYLNGKRNGKGKEYYYIGDIEFEGEYLNGEKHGKGKDYYPNGKIRFEGIYNNGKKWNGIGYDIKDNKVYEIKNGEGYIKEYNDEGKLYIESEYSIINPKVKAKEYYNTGNLKFEGVHLYSHKLSGKYYINGKFEYEGEFLYDKKWNGKGYNEKGDKIYELKNGTGKIKEYTDSEILEYEGECLNGKRNGKGKEYDYEGRLIFEGEFLNGKIWNGKGKEYYVFNGGLRFEGEYLNGKRNGKGIEYYPNGQIIFEGEYLNGIRNVKEKECNYTGKLIFGDDY